MLDLLNNFLASSLQTGDRIQIQRSACFITQPSFCWPGLKRKALYERPSALGVFRGGRGRERAVGGWQEER